MCSVARSHLTSPDFHSIPVQLHELRFSPVYILQTFLQNQRHDMRERGRNSGGDPVLSLRFHLVFLPRLHVHPIIVQHRSIVVRSIVLAGINSWRTSRRSVARSIGKNGPRQRRSAGLCRRAYDDSSAVVAFVPTVPPFIKGSTDG